MSLCALQAWPAEQQTFKALDLTAQPDPSYVIGREADLAGAPAWTDLQARTQQFAELRRGSFPGAENRKIHYRLYQHRAETKGAVVLIPGRTEGLALYQETILDLVRNGYSVYIHDHRGQGFSERLVQSDPTVGYIDDFDHYVQDLAAFINGPVRGARKGRAGPIFLLAHSMGGAVAALYLEGAPAADVRAAALVTPMMEPWAAGGGKPGFVKKLVDAYCDRYGSKGPALPGVSAAYIQGAAFEQQYQQYRQAPDVLPNGASHSRLRYARNWETRRQAACEGADCGSADARVGGTSYRWLNQSCYASRQARGASAAGIGVPVLLLQGGQDIKVKPAAQAEFCANVNHGRGAGYCVGRTLVGAEHSVLIESDEFRVPALAGVLRFFDCAAGAHTAERRRCELAP